MARSLMFALVLVCSASWMQAQREDAGSHHPKDQGQSQQVQGCVHGSGDSYTLTDDAGIHYRLLGDVSKLREHVGHEVQITGLVSTVTDTTSSATAAHAGSSVIEIKDVRYISQTCPSSGVK